MDFLVFSILTITAIIFAEISTYHNIRKGWKQYHEETDVFCTLTDTGTRKAGDDPGKEQGAQALSGDDGPRVDRLHGR